MILKFYKTKTAKFLAGKGFYFVLALSLTVMGIAVYSMIDTTEKTEKNDSSLNQSLQSVIPPAVTKQGESLDMPVTEESEPADNSEEEAGYFILPVDGEILKKYDSEHLQYSNTHGDMRIHLGLDIKPKNSVDVVSAAKGVVTKIEENTTKGTVVTIEHIDGIVIRYAGVKNLNVKENDELFAGDILGEVGTVSNECGDEPHIHLEVIKNGKEINPEEVFDIN